MHHERTSELPPRSADAVLTARAVLNAPSTPGQYDRAVLLAATGAAGRLHDPPSTPGDEPDAPEDPPPADALPDDLPAESANSGAPAPPAGRRSASSPASLPCEPPTPRGKPTAPQPLQATDPMGPGDDGVRSITIIHGDRIEAANYYGRDLDTTHTTAIRGGRAGDLV